MVKQPYVFTVNSIGAAGRGRTWLAQPIITNDVAEEGSQIPWQPPYSILLKPPCGPVLGMLNDAIFQKERQ